MLILLPPFFNNADKPPIEELNLFLEFQLPRQWAPVFGEIPLGPQHKKCRGLPSLQFTLMGPRLLVNTTQVEYLHSYKMPFSRFIESTPAWPGLVSVSFKPASVARISKVVLLVTFGSSVQIILVM